MKYKEIYYRFKVDSCISGIVDRGGLSKSKSGIKVEVVTYI
jgi:hypothetical protein